MLLANETPDTIQKRLHNKYTRACEANISIYSRNETVMPKLIHQVVLHCTQLQCTKLIIP